MKKALFIVFISLVMGGCTIPFFTSKKAALQVNSNPQASVFLNDNRVGQTPYFDDQLKSGEYTVKIEVENDPSKSWQTSITLSPQIITVLDRQFGATAEESSHHLLQLEPLASKTETEISIITLPDNVVVKLDGQPEGFSPVSIKDVSVGDHTITLAAPGYQEKTIKIQTQAGYKLIVSATLARAAGLEPPPSDETATDSAELAAEPEAEKAEESDTTTKPTPTKKPTSTATSSAQLDTPYVTITETGTGWLRVRSAPNATADNEVAKIDVGDSFPFVEKNETGWYKIEYESGKEGWISGRYADLHP